MLHASDGALTDSYHTLSQSVLKLTSYFERLQPQVGLLNAVTGRGFRKASRLNRPNYIVQHSTKWSPVFRLFVAWLQFTRDDLHVGSISAKPDKCPCCTVSVTAVSQSVQENWERHFKKYAKCSETASGVRFYYSCEQEVTGSKTTRWETADVVWRPYVKYTIFRTRNRRETALDVTAATNIGWENTFTCHTNRTEI